METKPEKASSHLAGIISLSFYYH